ncbi:MAG: cobyrinic acid a,c-diamide synthase [Hydrogenophilales bacterium 28-61-11]|nr:MAG: cobyrinic acid a,c-diamide synthase [Hydrogenophilales bacterium 28-61-11]OYZ57370.1 MAG: cobyrinic acid a,c-diamide synthase [Hydrogenophilales bacterium 16-61-112]OZA48274.1 MAG: cobyrinic acid a,c-diamide synthase [Hydrogenophilales bacterium 17-61-76]
MPRVFISAAHKSSGKTTLSIGLCAALSKLGYAVQPFKKGPDYIDPLWLGMAADRPCYNLDFHMMTRAEIETLFFQSSCNNRISLIEGNKGLYDGLDLDGSNSNAALAKLLGAPVVLVIDARGMTRGVAPLILGYQAFDPEINIAGVILNNLGGSRHESKLRAVIEHYTDLVVIGAVQHDASMHISERHLGLVPANEQNAALKRIQHVGRRVADQVDLHRFLAIADGAATCACSLPPVSLQSGKRLRIGIAYDQAFGFYYSEDIDSLRAANVDLIHIDTLNEANLPPLDGLIIGGGFPEVFMDQLESNESLRSQVRQAISDGLPTYAECGGLMYLSRSLNWKGQTRQMVGLVPGDTVMHERPVGRGYAILHPTGSDKWQESENIPAHEFHYSSLENLPADSIYAYRVKRGHGIDGHHDGYQLHNLLAGYVHRRGSGARGWIGPFLQQVRAHKAHEAT